MPRLSQTKFHNINRVGAGRPHAGAVMLRFDPMLKLDKKHILHRFIEHTRVGINAVMAFLMCRYKTYSGNLFASEHNASEQKATPHVKTILVFIDCDRIVQQ